MPEEGEEKTILTGEWKNFGIDMIYAGMIGFDTFSIVHDMGVRACNIYFQKTSTIIRIDKHLYDVLDVTDKLIRLSYKGKR